MWAIHQFNQFIKNDEVAEILELIVRRIRITSSYEKREIYVDTFLNMLKNEDELSHDIKLSILESLEMLTVQDLRIFSKFPDDLNVNVAELLNSTIEINGSKEERLSILIVTLSKLQSRGLINKTDSPGTKVYVGVGSPDKWTNRWLDSYYTILPFGKNVRNIINKL